jgi:hypothetical protein
VRLLFLHPFGLVCKENLLFVFFVFNFLLLLSLRLHPPVFCDAFYFLIYEEFADILAAPLESEKVFFLESKVSIMHHSLTNQR